MVFVLLQVYLFSGGKVKVVVNKQFSNIKNNYEITFDTHSEIVPCNNDASIKTQQYSFIPISQLVNSEVNSTVDVVAIVKSHTDVSEIISQKLGK